MSSPKTAWSLALLALTVLAFVGWLLLSRRHGRIGQGVFVALMAVDLLVFAYDFHPSVPLSSLTPGLPGGTRERTLMHDSADLPAFEPDQLLALDIPTTEGYSSLPSQRHVEIEAATSADPRLFDLWSATQILEPPDPSDLHVVDGVRFRTNHPLMAGFGGSGPETFQLPSGTGPVVGVRVIGTLSYAYNVPQGQTVATLVVGSQTLPLRAGIELSERAYDRPSLRGLLQHQKAADALDFEETTPEGEDYTAHLYRADVPLSPGVSSGSLSITPTLAAVLVQIHGVAVVDAAGTVTSLDLADRAGMRRVSDLLIQDSNALPRAYVLPATQAFSTARHPDLTATQIVASPDMDVHTMVLIENDPNAASAPDGSVAATAATRVEDLGPNAVRIEATADAPGYLVLDDFYHRGWTARLDGQPARVLIANALFRAVAIPAGTHVVEFQFAPLSLTIGAAISAVSLLLAFGALAWSLRRR